MTVINTFQCDVCYRPCEGLGAVTLVLEQEGGTLNYMVLTRSLGPENVPLKDGQMLRHICANCVDSISGRTDKITIPAEPIGPRKQEDKE